MNNHKETFRAGEAGYYSPRQRGTVDVWFDSKRFIYYKPYYSLVEFKHELAEAFADRGCPPAKVTGKYPAYRIETVN